MTFNASIYDDTIYTKIANGVYVKRMDGVEEPVLRKMACEYHTALTENDSGNNMLAIVIVALGTTIVATALLHAYPYIGIPVVSLLWASHIHKSGKHKCAQMFKLKKVKHEGKEIKIITPVGF